MHKQSARSTRWRPRRTRLLGLHGLYIEAQRRADIATAQLYAEEAARHAQVPAWAGQAVLEFRCVTGDWAGALERLDRNMKSGLIDKASYQRQRAVLLTARALASEEMDRDRAKADVLEAVKLAPRWCLPPCSPARLLGEAGELRKAGRIIEAAWRANPHPDLAEGYAHLRPGDSARERLARDPVAGREVARQHRGRTGGRPRGARRAGVRHRPASAGAARRRADAAGGGVDGRTRGERAQRRGPRARMDGRALHGRRDPAWTADGFVSQRWLPISPVTGRLDAFEWKDPLSGLDRDRPVIEAGPDPDATVNVPATVERRPAHETPLDLAVEKPAPAPPRAEEPRAEPVIEPPPPRAARVCAPRGPSRRCRIRRP